MRVGDMYGCFLLEVWAGVIHCRAVHLSVVERAITRLTILPFGTDEDNVIRRGAP